MLTGDNSGAPLLVISAQGARLRYGQQVVTSGDGALLPAGLAIGKVYWDGTDFRAALFADAGRSDDVRVLDLKLTSEKPPTPTANDLPVTAAGLPPLKQAPPPKPAPPQPQPQAPVTAAATPPPAAPVRRSTECDANCLMRKELRGEALESHIRRLGQQPMSQQSPPAPPPDQISPDDQ